MIKNIINIFFNNFLKKFPSKFFYLFFLLLFESLILASSVITIIPLADYFIDPTLKNPSRISEEILRLLSIFNIKATYVSLSLLFVATNLVRSIFAIYLRFLILNIKYSIVRYLTKDLLQNILSVKLIFFNNLGHGKLLNTLNKEMIKIGDMTGHLATMFAMVIQFCTYLIIPLALDFKLTFSTIFFAIILSLPFFLLNRYVISIGSLNTITANKFTGLLNETIQASRMIIGFGNQKKIINKNINVFDQHVDTTVKFQLINSLPALFFVPLSILSIIISIGITSGINKNISELAAIFWSLYALMPILSKILQSNNLITNFLPSYNQFNSIIEKAKNQKEHFGNLIFKNLNHNIEFKNVHFGYSKEKKEAIRDLSFEIEKNKITALVGKSGSGKSTIVDLLLGLQKPTKGEILLEKSNLDKFDLNSYRKEVGFVPQEPFLFYATIRENLMWSNPSAKESEIVESLKISNAYEFVMKLPKKLDTLVGERGAEISGGERQRVVLARAIVRKPKLLILDEATSSLDANSENLINDALKKISKFTTIIIVAHKSSSLEISDNLYVLKDGGIIEKGHFNDLVKNNKSEFFKTTQV